MIFSGHLLQDFVHCFFCWHKTHADFKKADSDSSLRRTTLLTKMTTRSPTGSSANWRELDNSPKYSIQAEWGCGQAILFSGMGMESRYTYSKKTNQHKQPRWKWLNCSPPNVFFQEHGADWEVQSWQNIWTVNKFSIHVHFQQIHQQNTEQKSEIIMFITSFLIFLYPHSPCWQLCFCTMFSYLFKKADHSC